MAQQDRLAALQVRVARHEDPAVGVDAVEQCLEQSLEGRVESGQFALEPEADVGGYLIVAGAGGVELAAAVADPLDQSRLDIDEKTAITRWLGESIDYGQAIDALVQLDGLT